MQISLRIERARRPFLMSSTDRSPLLEILVQQLVVALGRGLDHLRAPLVALRAHLGRNLAIFELRALGGIVPPDLLHANEIDDAGELVFGADRQLDRHGDAAQARLDLVDAAQEVGAGAIHLVDERDARHLVAVHLAPHGLGLRLHAGDRAEHCDGAVEHAQAALHFDREVDVARGVDDVDAMLGEVVLHPLPEARGRRGRDRDAALLLLLHVVHDRSAVVHFADLVRYAGVEKDALGRGRLPRVDVRGDADVPVSLDGSCTWHGMVSSGWTP